MQGVKKKEGDQCPGQRTGRQDKPSGTEIYGVRIQSRGTLESRSGVTRVERDIYLS